jgi:hypothetical protein
VGVEDARRAEYRLGCRRCGHHWVACYDVVGRHRGDGQTVQLFYQEGMHVPSPWLLVECPRCRADWTRVLDVRPAHRAPEPTHG